MHLRTNGLALFLVPLTAALAATPAGAQSWGTTTRVSVSSTGAEANGESLTSTYPQLCVSGGGRFVSFNSTASNLVAGDTNAAPDVFVHDLLLGTTERASVSSSGGQGNADSSGRGSYGSALSGDGRYLAFHSFSANLVAGDSGNQCDVFVRDRAAGTTERVSLAPANKSPNGPSQTPSISSDGRYVLFDSYASNLVSNDRNKQWDVFRRDRWTGATVRVSVSTSGAEGNQGSWRLVSGGNTLSADGRCAVFASLASNLVSGDTNNNWDVFVRDIAAGTTERVSVTPSGAQADGACDNVSISADGLSVAFLSRAPNLLAPFGAPANVQQLFVHDRVSGTTHCASVSSAGVPASTGVGVPAALSADGRLVAFFSTSANLDPTKLDSTAEVFVRDLVLGTTTRVPNSFAPAGQRLALDDSGAVIAFGSGHAGLVPGDTNGVRDVFVAR